MASPVYVEEMYNQETHQLPDGYQFIRNILNSNGVGIRLDTAWGYGPVYGVYFSDNIINKSAPIPGWTWYSYYLNGSGFPIEKIWVNNMTYTGGATQGDLYVAPTVTSHEIIFSP
jgi:hypothetical protein